MTKTLHSFFYIYSYDLGTACGFLRCYLTYGCSSIYVGLVFQVPNILSKRNWYLLNRLWSIDISSSVNFFSSDATFYGSDYWSDHIRCGMYAVWHLEHVWYPIVICFRTFCLWSNQMTCWSFNMACTSIISYLCLPYNSST